MSEAQQEAMTIEGEAWPLVKAFDDAAEGKDRTVAYAAMILIMTSFCRTSHASADEIMEDFTRRIAGGWTSIGAKQ